MTPSNRMLQYLTIEVVLYAAILGFFGVSGVKFFAIQGVLAFSIVETINYIEHYGITRRELAPGVYESVQPRHSWNSSHPVTNWFMFNVGRHSDHHYKANRCYTDLRHFDDAPQLPAGLFAMFVLALFPPLWRHIMDARVEVWRRQVEVKQ